MDKLEYHTIIKFLQLKGKTPTEIKADQDSVYGFTIAKFHELKY